MVFFPVEISSIYFLHSQMKPSYHFPLKAAVKSACYKCVTKWRPFLRTQWLWVTTISVLQGPLHASMLKTEFSDYGIPSPCTGRV